jgi:hypothetical protein
MHSFEYLRIGMFDDVACQDAYGTTDRRRNLRNSERS